MSVSGGADEEAADDGSEGAAVVNCGPSLAGGCVGVSGLVLDIVAAAERATRSRMPSTTAGFRTMSLVKQLAGVVSSILQNAI